MEKPLNEVRAMERTGLKESFIIDNLSLKFSLDIQVQIKEEWDVQDLA